MQTNRARLHEVVLGASKRNDVPNTHQQNEGGWNVMAVEPILEALEWPRVAPDSRRLPDTNGAAYEWPGNHKIDFALLVKSEPVALMQCKGKAKDCRKDLLSPGLLKYSGNIANLAFGIYSWHEDGGGFGWMPFANGKMDATRDVVLHLKDVVTVGSVDPLAALARPVILGQVKPESWLDAEISDFSPIVPRIDLINIQNQFFNALCSEIHRKDGIEVRLLLRHSKKRSPPPTPTGAYTELPGLLPENWGITCAVWGSEDKLKCMFYRGSKDHDKRPVILNYLGTPTPAAIDEFVRERVIPRLNEHRRASSARK